MIHHANPFLSDETSGDQDVLLQTGCPDCIVTKGNDTVELILLFSKEKPVIIKL